MTPCAPFLSTTSRNIPLVPSRSALLFVDVQNGCALPHGGEFKSMGERERSDKYGYFFDTLNNLAIPNMQRIQAASRAASIETLYTTIECLTLDGRDRGLDYKISGFFVPRGSWDGQVIDALKPGEDEIVLPKSSSSVFNSTQIDYLMRNLGVAQLVICGILTDQCVESAVRDACDLGYLVTLVPDACATISQERHDNSLRALSGYCRQIATDDLIAEIRQRSAASDDASRQAPSREHPTNPVNPTAEKF